MSINPLVHDPVGWVRGRASTPLTVKGVAG